MSFRPTFRSVRRACVLLLLLLLLLPPVHDSGGQEEDVERGRRAWFVASSIPEQVENPIQVLAGSELHEVTLSRRMVGNPVRIPADGLIQVVRPLEGGEQDGEPAWQTIASARIPEGVNQALIFLVPAPQPGREDGRVFLTSVQDLAGFQGGDYLFLNLSPLNIAVQLGDERKQVAPGGSAVSRAPRLREPVNLPVSYHFQDRSAGEWRLISASTVVRLPTRREICIFSWDPRFERINYHGVTFPVSP